MSIRCIVFGSLLCVSGLYRPMILLGYGKQLMTKRAILEVMSLSSKMQMELIVGS